MNLDQQTEKQRLEQTVIAYFAPQPPEFKYDRVGGVVTLSLMTSNPRHSQRFLFHQCQGANEVQALEEMLSYIREHRALEPTYTVQWRAFGEQELHTSYFSAPNVLMALDKFFYGRDVHAVTVFSVMLNPLS
jgi:hypothetical protein